MRVTEKNRFNEATFQRTHAAAQLQKKANVAATGNRVNVASDDPYAFSVGQKATDRIALLGARKSAVQSAQSDLELGESSLASATDLMAQAKELAVQGRNGTMDAASRKALGEQVESIRSSLLSIANAKGASGYLFGGTATQTPPFDAAGAFVGNDNAKEVPLSDTMTVRGNGSGAQAFTAAGGTDVFADLANLATALKNNDVAGIDTGMTKMDAGHAQVVGARVSAGLAAERLGTGADIMSAAADALAATKAAAVEADPVNAYSDFTLAQQSYERSLAVTKQLLQTSSVGNS